MNYKNKAISKVTSIPSSIPSKQGGAALLGVVLIILVVVSLLSLTASKTTIMETKMVFNMQDKQRSLLAADSAALYAWEQVQLGVDLKKMIDNENEAGFYILGDTITVKDKAKTAVDWNLIENVVSWPWQDDTKRFEIPLQLGGSDNPMRLVSTPQYTVGMQNSVWRKGTSDYHCIPMSVIGASQGGLAQTRTLIELKIMPKSTCYHEKVK